MKSTVPKFATFLYKATRTCAVKYRTLIQSFKRIAHDMKLFELKLIIFCSTRKVGLTEMPQSTRMARQVCLNSAAEKSATLSADNAVLFIGSIIPFD